MKAILDEACINYAVAIVPMLARLRKGGTGDPPMEAVRLRKGGTGDEPMEVVRLRKGGTGDPPMEAVRLRKGGTGDPPMEAVRLRKGGTGDRPMEADFGGGLTPIGSGCACNVAGCVKWGFEPFHNVAELSALAKALRRETLAKTIRNAKNRETSCFFIDSPPGVNFGSESDPLEVEPRLKPDRNQLLYSDYLPIMSQ